MAIQRWTCHMSRMWANLDVDYVTYADHAAIVERLIAEPTQKEMKALHIRTMELQEDFNCTRAGKWAIREMLEARSVLAEVRK